MPAPRINLSELARLEREATPGEWHRDDYGGIWDSGDGETGSILGEIDAIENAALIVAARNALPSLIALAEAAARHHKHVYFTDWPRCDICEALSRFSFDPEEE